MLDPNNLNLRQLVDWLMTPAHCGVYLSVDDLSRIGEEIGVLVAAMNRRLAMEQLFRAAALDGAVDQLFKALDQEFQAHRSRYQTINSPAMTPWLERLDQASVTLEALSAAWREHEQAASPAQFDTTI